jgi:hypothetical protein
MNAALDGYRRDLLLQLRNRGVPEQRIAEAIAEVESHVAETGEEPHVAFGHPGAYAAELAQSLGHTGRALLGPAHPTLVAIAALAGAALMTSAVLARVRGSAWTGSSTVLAAGGAVLLGIAVLGGLRGRYRATDPRTGRRQRVPASRWALPVVVGVTLAALVAVVIFGALAH